MDARDIQSNEPFAKIYRQIRAFTMCSNSRLRGLHSAVRDVVTKNIPGDLVECGTARGGSACLMGLTLKELGAKRLLWVFDTFDGIPAPTADDPDFQIARLYAGSFRGSLEEVNALFDAHGISAQCRLVKGRFQETLSESGVRQIAVLHIDGDWYDSVKTCLDHFYDRVSPGGVIQIDDYGHWEGARKAVDEFIKKRSISSPLRSLDYSGRQFVKP
jgi:Macrocin-O-methyltransferase (TylF)